MRRVRHHSVAALGVAALIGSFAACGADDSSASISQVAAQSLPPTSGAPARPSPDSANGPTQQNTASSIALDDVLVLGRDGLGVAKFGDGADATVAAVAAVLGEPEDDSGWVDPLTISNCAGEQARVVVWGTLYLYFGDQPVAGAEHSFFSYSYGHVSDLAGLPQGLATPEGIGLGTTVAFLRAAYAGVAVESGEEGFLEPSFYVDDQLSGRLTGGADDDLVTVIIGGDPCAVGM